MERRLFFILPTRGWLEEGPGGHLGLFPVGGAGRGQWEVLSLLLRRTTFSFGIKILFQKKSFSQLLQKPVLCFPLWRGGDLPDFFLGGGMFSKVVSSSRTKDLDRTL